MGDVAVTTIPGDCLPPPKARRLSFLSSGRGGSGNIRRTQVPPTDSERFDDLAVSGPRESRSTTTADHRPERSQLQAEYCGSVKQHFSSNGRGGSGNIQPSASDLGSHPQTATILSQYNAKQTRHEQWVRKNHTESKVVHSSGRGGSGNISDTRRRSHSQEHTTAPKRRLFTTKGRERGAKVCDDVAVQAHDREDGSVDRRISHVTCSSGSDIRSSQERPVSNAVTSTNSMIPDSWPGEPATAGLGKRHGIFVRWSKPPSPRSSILPPASMLPRSPPASPIYPTSLRTDSSGSGSRVYSSASVTLKDQPYVSFLEL